MKHIISNCKGLVGKLALALLTLPMLTACSDFLDIEPQDIIVLEKFWQEKTDVDNVVTGCYTELQSQACIDRMMVWGEFRSENIVAGTNAQNNASLTNILNENINASNVYTTWDTFYKVINDCNTVVKYAPSVAEKDPSFSQSELNATIAEVSALRDLCYWYLIRTFRDVPYTTTAYIDDTQEMAQPATPFDDVLDSLITDLESVQDNAVKTYPTSQEYYQTGRITQDAIHAMLCDMYLWKQDYQKAVYYADLVIDAKTQAYQEELDQATSISSSDEMINGYPLISDQSTSYYGEAFNSIFGSGNSRESIFELTFMDDDNMPVNTSVSYFYGNNTTFPGIVKPADFITSDLTLDQPEVFLTKYDTRYYENLLSAGSGNYGIAKYATQDAYVTASSSTVSVNHGNLYAEAYCHANWIIYRLTDVMLMKAEALVQMIPDDDESETGTTLRDSLLQEAYDIVNTINLRSNCATTKTDISYSAYSSKTEMTNLIYDERERELMFEGKRWYDLVRRSRRDGNTSYLISQVTRKGSDNASVVQSKLAKMDAIYWPYNKEELKVNKNLTQNPAFGSGDDTSYEKN